MTKGEKVLCFAAQALGGATLIGLWIEYLDGTQPGRMAVLLILSAVLLLVLALAAIKVLRVRGPMALGKMAVYYASGVALAMTMGALILLLLEMNTAFTGMMMLIRHGSQR